MIDPQNTRIPIAVSSCLLGEQVRYDGSHKRSKLICNELEPFCEFTSICPEAGIGLGVPRDIIRLVKRDKNAEIRAIQIKDQNIDITNELQNYVNEQHHLTDVCGYIFKSKSPSCGLSSTKIYRDENSKTPIERGSGIFAMQFTKDHPLIPCIDDGPLNDHQLKENFIARIFAYKDWKENVETDYCARNLIEFHSRYKYTIMAHSLAYYKELGRLVAGVKNQDAKERSENYIVKFMEGLKIISTIKNNANVLYHILGYLREKVDGKIRQEIVDLIEQYRRGMIPLIVPISFYRHYFEKHPDEYILKQNYLNPYPDELKLRNFT
jgi:uncharacterized protein YbgA (DUF1722 family)/uncharacterized protein YbbK (DUF523 family)